MRALSLSEATCVSGGMTLFGGTTVYSYGDLANGFSSDFGGAAGSGAGPGGGGGMTWGDVAIISGVLSAGAFSASAIPSPATLPLVFVGLTTAGLAGLAQYIDNHKKERP